jgi:hypothetical protein
MHQARRVRGLGVALSRHSERDKLSTNPLPTGSTATGKTIVSYCGLLRSRHSMAPFDITATLCITAKSAYRRPI